MQVPAEEVGQAGGFQLDRLGWSSPASSQVTVSSSPFRTHAPHTTPPTVTGLTLRVMRSRRDDRGDVDVRGARTDHPLIVPGKEPHHIRWKRSHQGVDVLAHDVRRSALSIDRDQPIAEVAEP